MRKKPAIGSFIRLAASENGTMDFYNLYGGSYKPSPSPFVSDFKWARLKNTFFKIKS